MSALKASLENRTADWDSNVSREEIEKVFHMAKIHHILPMIYESVCRIPSIQKNGKIPLELFMKEVVDSVVMQTIQTNEFLQLYDYLRKEGVQPCVVKGIICRVLYPNQDARRSGDEDLFIPENMFMKTHQCMLDYGMDTIDPGIDPAKAHEIAYVKPGSMLRIELHKTLFPQESEAYGMLNKCFEGSYDRKIVERILGTRIVTMDHTDHLLYLICHAFKHFLHSGFGIRQVCDIVLYANTYGEDIDWDYILDQCREIRADLFAAAIFRIGRIYLTFDPKRAAYPKDWQEIEVDEKDMLYDLLDSGVFGQSDMIRKHSSNITLSAVAADRRGKKARGSILSTLFLPRATMENQYHYLRKYPVLLPVAWVQRILRYRKETAASSGNDALRSIQIGNQRVELMKKYGIIKE